MPDLDFIGDWSAVGGMTLAFFLATVSALLYLRETRGRRDWLRWGLPLLRWLAVFLIAMILPRAVLTYRWMVGDMINVQVFVDLSRSMELRDDAMTDDRKLMVARRIGELEADLFDDDLEAAIRRLDTARETASRLEPKEAGLDFHQGVKGFATAMAEVFASIKKVGPGIWPDGASRRVEFVAEVVDPASQLADGVIGSDARGSHRRLMTLLNVAARWSDLFRSAWKAHVKQVGEQGAESTVKAREWAGTQTRLQRVEKYLFGGENGIAAQLSDTHRVEIVYLRGQSPLGFWSGNPETERDDRDIPTAFDLPATNSLTDLSQPIRERASAVEGTNRLAVVLLSDGQHNRGNPPIELARLFAQRGTPVYAIGVGMEQRPADIAVLAVNAQENVSLEGRVRGEIVLKDDMRQGVRFPLRIEHEGSVLWMTNMESRAEGVRRIAFDFSVKEAAAKMAARNPNLQYESQPIKLSAVAGRLADDKDPSNNESDFRVAVGNKTPRVLLLDGRPRWEFRYLRNLFARDSNWEVNNLLAGAGGVNAPFLRGVGPGKFPDSQEELNRYDLVIFGDVSVGQFSPQELNWFANFVTDRGGGMIFIDGRRERLASFGSSPLGLLMPVRFKTGYPVFEKLPMKYDVPAVNDLLSPMNLTGDPEKNRLLWGSLRGPHWVSDVEAKAGTETLVSMAYGPQRFPAMVFQRIGSGKTLYVGFDESWRWRFNVGDLYHQRFWNQVANWVMEPPFQVRDKFVAMDTGRLRYETGEKAQIRVRPLKEALRRVAEPVVSLVVERDGVPVATVRLAADQAGGGVFRGETPPLADGEYETRVRIDGLLDSLILARTTFSVGPKSRMELAQLHCNVPLLKEIAQETGGRYLPEEEIDSVVDLLAPLSKGVVMEDQIELWNSYWWFVPVILLLGTEWFLRKRAGLI
jgi:hypothetical protein